MKAYVLSLPRDTERLAVFKKELDKHLPGCQYEIPEMFDATHYSEERLREIYDKRRAVEVHYRELGKREIGNILSQQSIYKAIITDGSPYALIFEDDVKLSNRLQAAFPFIEQWFAARRNEPTVLLLSQARAFRLWKAHSLGDGIHRVCRPLAASGNYGYMLNPLAAQRLLAYNSPISHLPDAWEAFQKKGVVHVYGIVPYLAGNYDFDRKQSNLSKERLELWKQAHGDGKEVTFVFRCCCRIRSLSTNVINLLTGVTVVTERTNDDL